METTATADTQDRRGELADRAAIVTGSARNIGRAIALALADAGAAVLVHAHSSQAAAEETAAMIRGRGGRAAVAMTDLADPAGGETLAAACLEAFARLDILVNNAALRLDQPIGAISFDDWRRVTGSILDASFLCIKAALPHLRRSDGAAIVNIGGVAGHVGVGNRAHVAAAKAAVAGLTRAAAAELAADGITVNCVAPGRIETVREGPLPDHFRDRPVPLKSRGLPEDVGALVRYLAGPQARFLTGQTIHFNGGWHMGG